GGGARAWGGVPPGRARRRARGHGDPRARAAAAAPTLATSRPSSTGRSGPPGGGRSAGGARGGARWGRGAAPAPRGAGAGPRSRRTAASVPGRVAAATHLPSGSAADWPAGAPAHNEASIRAAISRNLVTGGYRRAPIIR